MHTLSRLLAALLFLSLAVVLACQAPAGSTSAAAATPSPTEAAAPVAGSGTAPLPTDAVAQAEEIATDRYPALLFGLLNPEERARFVSLAEADLCPCEGQVTSLDACLRTVETTCSLAAQVGALTMRMIKEGADNNEISAMVQGTVANARRVVEFNLEGLPWKGAETPVLTLVEFADFQCPACRQFSDGLREVVARHGEQVRVYYRHFPLPTHMNAAMAAVAANAAGRQGKFWEYHDLLFENQSALSATNDPMTLFVGLAEQLGINTQRFSADMSDPAVIASAEADRTAGNEAGLEGTPTLYINGVRLLDGYDTPTLLSIIEQRLAAP